MTNLARLTKSQLDQMREAKDEKLAYLKAHPFKSSGAEYKAAHARLVQSIENEIADIESAQAQERK